MWWGIDLSGPYPFMKGFFNLHILFAWFNPGLPNFANTLSRAVYANQGVYILPKLLTANIMNIADFGNATIFHLQKFCIAAKMYRGITQLHDMPDFL